MAEGALPRKLVEAKKVLDAVDDGEYPPTNPAVLLEAARTIYLNQLYFAEPQAAIQRILIWTMQVIEANSPGSLPHRSAEHLIQMSYHEVRGG